ncbi:oxidoreductase, 2OG-Fe(II) oxygenase family protein [Teladorsagia circumcincta]|uniref:Oxidoreductase, 2OG-Fe(II) oxygenase family protein n=1 Tax=Teladorsagia circumcincta TaxID=45464 RepID=A0A2G9UZW2_TELCI|nr:oxidoreductase, 2OG-Fe(II) oxygenase family protein [Teladorsagia circumcincta]
MKLLILAFLVVLAVEGASKGQKSKDTKKASTTSKKSDALKKRMNKWFEGKEHWSKKHLQLCFQETPLPKDYFCYKYYRNYEPIYIDPLALHPILIVYRRLIPQKLIDGFLRDVDEHKKMNKKKHIDEDGFMKNFLKRYTKRRAISTTLPHSSTKGVAKVFRRIQALIPMLNFSISEPWKVLHYKKGGHHAPHHDFITYSSPDQYSERTQEFGNRFVTFAITLKSPTVGGATSFVLLNHTVTTEPGDVILFTCIRNDMTPAGGSVHGECPVEEGEKITATLWLRPKGQELFNSLPKDEGMMAYDIEKLIAPNMMFYGQSPFYDLYAYQQLMAEEFARQNQLKQAQI